MPRRRQSIILPRFGPCRGVAELLRIKGELLLLENSANAYKAAEDHFLQCLDWAGIHAEDERLTPAQRERRASLLGDLAKTMPLSSLLAEAGAPVSTSPG